MKAAGIICEYNPLHLGHQRQLRWLKEEQGIDALVLAMSGNFVQRGQPAVVNKEIRTRMALAAGADLVLELPALFALRSAYWFALGGVSLLAATGVTDFLAFGAETGDLAALEETAQRLAFPDSQFKEALKRYLSAGLPYAEAQAKALCCGDGHCFAPSLPNDILALAYLQVIAQRKVRLKPLLLQRKGGGYLSRQLTEGIYPSAAACRSLLYRTLRQEEEKNPDSRSSLSYAQLEAAGFSAYLPETTLRELAGAGLVFPADWEAAQLTLLRRADQFTFSALPDMGEGLENRLQDAALRAGSMAEFYRLAKTRRYPLTRLMRLTAHLFLDYRETQAAYLAEGVPYIRVLGANGTGCRLLGRMRKTAALPIITRTNQAERAAKISPACRLAWELEKRCGSLYSLLERRPTPYGNPECLFSPVILP